MTRWVGLLRHRKGWLAAALLAAVALGAVLGAQRLVLNRKAPHGDFSKEVRRQDRVNLARMQHVLTMIRSGDFGELHRYIEPSSHTDQVTPGSAPPEPPDPSAPDTHPLEFRFRNFPRYPVSLPADWRADPFGDRSWRLYFNSLEWLQPILSVAPPAGDLASSAALAVVEDWIAQHAEWPSANEFAYHEHATAMRVSTLLLARRALVRAARVDLLRANRLDAALVAHAALLGSKRIYKGRQNHGILADLAATRALEPANGLRFRGDLVPFIGERLRRQFEYAFTSEGVHKEHSPCYFHFVLGLLMESIARVERLEDPVRARALWDIAHRTARFYTHILRADGRMPPIGDCDAPVDYRQMSGDEAARYFAAHPELLYSRTRSAGAVPTERAAIFPESGWAIFRNDWHTRWNEEVLAVVQSDFFSLEHFHQDNTSFVLSAFGDDYVVDSGHYSYGASDYRTYEKTAAAHNVLLIEDEPFALEPDWRGCAGITRHIVPAADAPGAAVELTHPHYFEKGYAVYRQFAQLSDRAFLVRDLAQGPPAAWATELLHLAPGAGIEAAGPGTLRVAWPGRAHALYIRGAWARWDVVAGQSAPMQGWIFPAYRTALPAPVLRLRRDGDADQAWAWPIILALSPVAETPDWDTLERLAGETVAALEGMPRRRMAQSASPRAECAPPPRHE